MLFNLNTHTWATHKWITENVMSSKKKQQKPSTLCCTPKLGSKTIPSDPQMSILKSGNRITSEHSPTVATHHFRRHPFWITLEHTSSHHFRTHPHCSFNSSFHSPIPSLFLVLGWEWFGPSSVLKASMRTIFTHAPLIFWSSKSTFKKDNKDRNLVNMLTVLNLCTSRKTIGCTSLWQTCQPNSLDFQY